MVMCLQAMLCDACLLGRIQGRMLPSTWDGCIYGHDLSEWDQTNIQDKAAAVQIGLWSALTMAITNQVRVRMNKNAKWARW